MKSSYLTNIILLLVAIALIWLLQQPQDNPEIHAIAPQVSMANVENIIIKRNQQDTVELQKTGKIWQLVQPIKAAAADNRVKMLFDLLTTATTEQFSLTEAMNVADFGLSDPTINLQFDDLTLKFGDIEALSGERYILRGDQVYLVKENISQLLQASASGFIENHLFAHNRDLQSLTLPYREAQALQNPPITLQLQNNQWQSANRDFSREQLTAIADSWQQIRAIQVSVAQAPPSEDFLPLEFGFDDGHTLKAYGRLSEQGLSILIPERQLQYQLPANTAISLFPLSPENSEMN